MRNKKQKLSAAFILLGFGSVFAQQSSVNAGGNATGSNGNVSYSVGQTFYATNTGSTGSTAPGVQQSYDIVSVLGTENHNINLQMSVYPNPTVSVLSLDVKNNSFRNLYYQLIDLNGRSIANEKIKTETTTISMEGYPSAVYLLKIIDDSKNVKTFKIIKK